MMKMTKEESLPIPKIVNGWTIYTHPLLLSQLNELRSKVEEQKKKDPNNYKNKNSFKRLAAILKLGFQIIPQDPSSPEYRQGNTLGKENKHWFRAKFYQRYRLFFRYHQKSKIIVLVWVNDESCLRTYNDKNDAYCVFKKMLETGNPPDSLEELIEESNKAKKGT